MKPPVWPCPRGGPLILANKARARPVATMTSRKNRSARAKFDFLGVSFKCWLRDISRGPSIICAALGVCVVCCACCCACCVLCMLLLRVCVVWCVVVCCVLCFVCCVLCCVVLCCVVLCVVCCVVCCVLCVVLRCVALLRCCVVLCVLLCVVCVVCGVCCACGVCAVCVFCCVFLGHTTVVWAGHNVSNPMTLGSLSSPMPPMASRTCYRSCCVVDTKALDKKCLADHK